MLCQNCHKNLASVRYAEVVDGKVSDLHLCQECLAQRQDGDKAGFQFAKPAQFGRKSKPTTDITPEPLEARKSCVACNTTLKQILDSGRVGCSSCYETFPAQLESLLEGIHIALAHRGKIPRMNNARARVRIELQSKRALLKTALNMENYEEAAALRDEIKVLETGLSVSGGGAD
jgi:protein arginine kinase activator